jgi:hypothetical protein
MTQDPSRTWIRRVSTAAGLAYTAIAEYELARRLGARPPIAVMLPLSLDCYVIAALKWFKAFDVALSLILMCAAQIAAHALEAGVVKVSLNLVTVVSVLVPVALWRTHALARSEGDDHHAAPESQYEAAVERVPVPAAAPPVPEVYPAIEVRVPAVPDAVPPGVRLLPLVARPDHVRPAAEKVPGPAPEYTPPPDEVPVPAPQVPHEEPDPEPVDEEPEDEALYPDPLIPQVRADFPSETPGVRRLKETYGIGQPRAQRIRDELMGVRS